MEYWLILGVILALLGVIGSLVPALPGPTLSFISLLILYFVKGSEVFPTSLLIIFGMTMFILVLLDYLAPIFGAKMFGATRKGVVGACIGGLLGIFLFPPFGVFVGSFLGAVMAELLGGKQIEKALRAGVGTFLGSIFVLISQTIFSIVVVIYFLLKVN